MITKFICVLTFLVGQERVLMDYEKEEGEIGKKEIDEKIKATQVKSIEYWKPSFYVIKM